MTVIFNDELNELSDALRELSILEPAEIAKRLDEAGIKGKARACSFCPMANYLSKILGGGYFVTLDKVYILDAEFDFDDQIFVETPETVCKFIQQFDAGKYLFLDQGRPIE
jgi:hypothetical protein